MSWVKSHDIFSQITFTYNEKGKRKVGQVNSFPGQILDRVNIGISPAKTPLTQTIRRLFFIPFRKRSANAPWGSRNTDRVEIWKCHQRTDQPTDQDTKLCDFFKDTPCIIKASLEIRYCVLYEPWKFSGPGYFQVLEISRGLSYPQTPGNIQDLLISRAWKFPGFVKNAVPDF